MATTFSNQRINPDLDPDLPNRMPTPASRQLPAEAAGSSTRPVMERVLQSYAEYLGKVIGITARQLRRTSRDARRRTLSAYSEATYVAQDISALTRRQVNVVKQDYPVEALGILAGAGIIGGFALRIWRSHQS